MPHSELTYCLVFRTPVSIFTGLGVAGLLDRNVVRTAKWRPPSTQSDASGLPYIPGSTVKGRLRFFAERMARSGAFPGRNCLHPEGGPVCKDREHACMVCRLFGNPSIAAALKVRDALPTQSWKDLIRTSLQFNPNPVIHPDVEIRPGIALSRARRAALGDHLFFDEAVPALTFSGTLLLLAGVKSEEKRFLIAAGALVDGLGARKAAGRGQLEKGIQIVEAGK